LGKSLAILFVAVSGVIVATYSSILVEQAVVKQLTQRQSTTSDGVKMGGKSLHQHLAPSGVSPQ
jgi:preprotein translocase subunit SecF